MSPNRAICQHQQYDNFGQLLSRTSHQEANMATSTLIAQPIPHPSVSSGVPPPDNLPTILDEVRAAQIHLRSRLAGALTKPPPNIPESELPTVPLIDLAPPSTALPPRAKSSRRKSAPPA